MILKYKIIKKLVNAIKLLMNGLKYLMKKIILTIKTFDLILSSFGITRLSFHDYLITFESGSDSNQVVSVMITDRIDTEEFKKHFYERVLTKIQKARSIRVGWPGFYFWKEIDPKVAQSVVYKLDLKLKTEQEMIDYVNAIVPEKLDTKKPLYEFRVCEEYLEDKSVFFVKFHHCFTDGIGIFSIISCIFDECLTTKFPKNVKVPGVFDSLLLGLITPYYVYKSLSLAWNWKTDPIASKCKELKDVPNKFENQFLCSRDISFDDIKSRFKKKKSGFTPYMLGILSKSFYQWFEHYGVKNAKQIAICVATGLRNFPKTYDEVSLDNGVAFTKIPLPVTSEVNSGMEILKNTMKTMFDPRMVL